MKPITAQLYLFHYYEAKECQKTKGAKRQKEAKRQREPNEDKSQMEPKDKRARGPKDKGS